MPGERQYYVYILSNKTDSTVYIGVTGDLMRRLQEHGNGKFQNTLPGRALGHVFRGKQLANIHDIIHSFIFICN